MKTNFFTEIAKLGVGQLSITITITKEVMAVSLLPIDAEAKDSSIKKLKPLSVTATPQELDEKYLELVAEPILETKSFINNTNAYLEQKKIAENASQIQKDKKDKIDKRVKELKDLMDKEDLIKENKNKIVKLIADIKSIDKDNSFAQKCNDKLLQLEGEQKSLF